MITYSYEYLKKISNNLVNFSQKTSLKEELDIVSYTDRFFSYLGSSQQMYLNILFNVKELINDYFYLFLPKTLKRKKLIKDLSEKAELNFRDKNTLLKLYYIASLYEGWIVGDYIEFNSPELNRFFNRNEKEDFLIPFTWLRDFKDEISYISLKNTLLLASRIKFNIKNIASIKGLIEKEKLQELYLKQQIIGFLIKNYPEIFTLNLNTFSFFTSSPIESYFLNTMEIY